jgi:hypothetical protein
MEKWGRSYLCLNNNNTETKLQNNNLDISRAEK